MLDVNNIHALSNFTRNARQHVKRLRNSGEPELLTVNGKAAVVVQDAAAYQRLLDDADLATAVLKIRKAIDRLDSGDEGADAKRSIEKLAADAGIRIRKGNKRR